MAGILIVKGAHVFGFHIPAPGPKLLDNTKQVISLFITSVLSTSKME